MISLLDKMAEGDFEQVLLCNDQASGLRGIIAIHDTTLGPAIGGTRMYNYSSEDEAIDDALRLAKVMTLKAGAAGLNLGGGSGVIFGNPQKDKTEALLRAFGRSVASLRGRFIAAEDVGISVVDIETIGLETKWVVGTGRSHGGSGNPTFKAAFGVRRGIQACLKHVFGDMNLRDRVIAIQGIGDVGFELARLASEDGARLKVSDLEIRKVDKMKKLFDVEFVPPEEILYTECDVLSPCALGGIFDETSVTRIKARIVAGVANNQLASESVADVFQKRNIVYAPDFVINSGGLINVSEELKGYDETSANSKVSRIFQEIEEILRISTEKKISTNAAAREKATDRIRKIRDVRRTFLPAA